MDIEKLSQRTSELEKFLHFVQESPILSDNPGMKLFFDEKIKDTEAGEKILHLKKLTYNEIASKMQKYYPEKFEGNYEENMEEVILKFKCKLSQIITFEKNFYQSIKAIAKTLKNSKLSAQLTEVLRRIVIFLKSSLSKRPQDAVDLDEKHRKLIVEKYIPFYILKQEAKMFLEEVKCLRELYSDFENLAFQKRKMETDKNKQLQNYTKVNRSTKVSELHQHGKELKRSTIQKRVEVCSSNIQIGQKLIFFASRHILDSQMEEAKKRRSQRFTHIIEEFVSYQREHNKREEEFWGKIVELNSGDLEADFEFLS